MNPALWVVSLMTPPCNLPALSPMHVHDPPSTGRKGKPGESPGLSQDLTSRNKSGAYKRQLPCLAKRTHGATCALGLVLLVRSQPHAHRATFGLAPISASFMTYSSAHCFPPVRAMTTRSSSTRSSADSFLIALRCAFLGVLHLAAPESRFR